MPGDGLRCQKVFDLLADPFWQIPLFKQSVEFAPSALAKKDRSNVSEESLKLRALLNKFNCTNKPKGNTDTSGLVSGLVPIRSGDYGAKFKPGYFLICIKNCIRTLSISFQDLEDF